MGITKLMGCLWLALSAALAQEASLSGFVKDESGAAVPGVDVTLVNTGTGIDRKTTANHEGYYAFTALPPGNYALRVQKVGFRPFERSGIRLDVQQIALVAVNLQVGAVQDKIVVRGETPLVSTEDATVGTVIDGRKLIELPLNGRVALNLVTLAPGTTPNPRGPAATAFNGMRPNNADVLVDGGSVTNTDEGDATLSPLLEGVEEFRAGTGSFLAESARAGGVINVVTRGGTNQLHGSIFEFFQNDDLDANNFFFNALRQGRQELRYNQYGGAIGGPIVIPKVYNGRNRTFFFYTQEKTHQQGSALLTSTIPTALERSGDFSKSGAGGAAVAVFDPSTTTLVNGQNTRTPFSGSIIPSSRFNPVATKFLSVAYPAPITSGAANNFFATSPSLIDTPSYQVRVDHNFTPSDRLSVTFLKRNNTQTNPQQYPGRPGEGGTTASTDLHQGLDQINVAAHNVLSIRPNLLNEFTYATYYYNNSLTPAATDLGWAQQLGIMNAAPYVFPSFTISGYNGVFGGNLSKAYNFNQEYADSVTWIKGTHVIKAGGDVRPLYFSVAQPAGTGGSFTFDQQPTRNPAASGAAAGGNSVASLLLGIPSSSSLTVNNVKFGSTWRYHALFIQDRWKLSTKLTLDYGLRWEYTRPREERHNRQSVFDLGSLTLQFAGVNGFRTELFNPNYKNFAPRIGLAYSPFGNSKTAIRAGFGLYYLPLNSIGALANFSAGFTASQTFQTTDGGITFPLTLSTAFPFVPITHNLSPLTSVYSIGPNYPTPYSSEWTLSLQQQVWGSTLLDATYVGQKGIHLQVNAQNVNQVFAQNLGPGNAQLLRPYPALGDVNLAFLPVANSMFHSLQLKVERRLSGGLNLLSWYTLQKSIDNSSADMSTGAIGVITVQDNHNFRAERSLSTFDRTHNFVTSALYELPFGKNQKFLSGGGILAAIPGGWHTNALATIRGGLPLSMTCSANTTGSLGGGCRPNRLSDGNLSGSAQSIRQWFNIAAFQNPAQFRFGNDSRTEPDLRGPGVVTVDLALFRSVEITERINLRIRAEAFNSLNRANFGSPATSIGAAGVGIITTADSPRIIQLGVRISF